MGSPGLPSISSGSPQTQGMTFADLLGYFKQGHLFFFLSFSETHARVVPYCRG